MAGSPKCSQHATGFGLLVVVESTTVEVVIGAVVVVGSSEPVVVEPAGAEEQADATADANSTQTTILATTALQESGLQALSEAYGSPPRPGRDLGAPALANSAARVFSGGTPQGEAS